MSVTERAPCPRLSHTQFRWDDPFLLEQQLTEEERLIRDTARQCAQEKLSEVLQAIVDHMIHYSA
jgi:hypothetical protein